MSGDRWLIFPGGGVLLVLIGLAIAADRIAPADPLEPLDAVAGKYLEPGSRRTQIRLADGSSLLADRATATPAGVTFERLGRRHRLAPSELATPEAPIGSVTERYFALGTDRFGRDLASRLLYGARISLTIATLAAGLALALGLLVGALAGTSGSAVDGLLMRFTDALLAFPNLLIVIALASIFEARAATTIVILGATGWMATARLARAEILALRQRDYILAAGAVGQSPAGILLRHLLPNALTPVIAHTALRVGDIILVEASLSFLGLGVAPPRPTWGNMIAEGSDALTTAWWVAALPGVAIALTVIALHLFGDGLRAWLDPRSR